MFDPPKSQKLNHLKPDLLHTGLNLNDEHKTLKIE